MSRPTIPALQRILPAIMAFMLAVPTQAAPLSQISVKGNRFVNAAGQTVVFRGLCTSDPAKLAKGGRWNKAYLEQAKS